MLEKPNILHEEENGGGGTGNATFSQDDVNNIVAKATKGLKEDFATMKTDFEAITAERDKFVTENKERDDKELSDLQLAQKDNETLKSQVDELTTSNTTYKEAQEARDTKETEKVEKAIEDLPDDQKALVEKLPLYDRMEAVGQFKNISPGGIEGGGKGNGASQTTAEAEYKKKLAGAKTPRERQVIQQAYLNGK